MKCPICNKGVLRREGVEYKEFELNFGRYPAVVVARYGLMIKQVKDNEEVQENGFVWIEKKNGCIEIKNIILNLS